VILGGAVVPLLVSALLGASALPVARRVPPRTAVPLLTAAAAVTAVATGFVLAVVAFTVAGSDAHVAALGHWSAPVVARLAQIPTPVGVVAGGTLLVIVAATVRRLAGVSRALWVANGACRHLGDGVDGLVIVDDDRPDAFALPGLQGRIVVSTAMLAALSPLERRVLFAHERSHLAHRHALFVQLGRVAAAANPLLRPVATAVWEAVERCADEDAATVVGDRRLAAEALARAAVASASPVPASAGTARLGMTDTAVVQRTRALLAPAPRPRRLLVCAVLGLLLAAGAGALVVEHGAERTFERAGQHSSRAVPGVTVARRLLAVAEHQGTRYRIPGVATARSSREVAGEIEREVRGVQCPVDQSAGVLVL
jgi:Zn-dependent protease with chaperone function